MYLCICFVKSAIINTMPRFQSRLFNWIEQSLPVRLGRNARKLIDRTLDQQLGQIRELPKLIAYQTARAALYPVYLLSKTTKIALKALQQVDVRADKQELSEGELSIDGNIKGVDGSLPLIKPQQELDMNNLDSLENPSQIPLLLRPLSRFINWIERTKLQIDRKIDQSVTAIAKASSSYIAKQEDRHKNDPNNLDTNQAKWIANQLFSQIWEQEVAKRIGSKNNQLDRINPNQDLTKVVEQVDLDTGFNSNFNSNLGNELNNSQDPQSSSSLYQKFTLGKNNRLEELRKLIKAAIAYFFGDQSIKRIDQALYQEVEQGLNSGLEQNPSIKANSPDLLSINQAESNINQEIQKINALKQINQLSTNSGLEKLRQLIAAAIDYFIGKRSLRGDLNIDANNILDKANNGQINNAVNHSQLDSLVSEELINSINQETENINEFYDRLQIEQRLERLRKLIEQAIAYFFDRQRSQPTLDEANDIATTEEAWLKMEDVFGDDQGPWPLPLEYESPAFTRSMNLSNPAAINSSGDLQNFETTTSQIYQERLDGSLYFNDEETSQSENSTSDRPLRAWLEAKATLWGYASNPVMDTIFWLDQVILKFENLLIAFWRKWVKFINSLTLRGKS
jgi:hypothetical protein